MKKGTRAAALFFFGVILILLNACIGIKTEVWVNEDGSGRLGVEYRMPVMLIDSIKENEQNSKTIIVDGVEIPEFLSEQKFRDEISGSKGLTLSAYRVRQDGEDIYVSCEIGFTQESSLEDLGFIPQISIKTVGETGEFSQQVCSSPGFDPQSEDAVRVYKNYKNTFILHTPREITVHNMGILSEDKRTLTFEYKLLTPYTCGSSAEKAQGPDMVANW